MNTTIKFGLAALAVGAFSILPGKADNTTPDSFTRHGLPIPGAYFKNKEIKNKESQQLATIVVSNSGRASDKRSRQFLRAGRNSRFLTRFLHRVVVRTRGDEFLTDGRWVSRKAGY